MTKTHGTPTGTPGLRGWGRGRNGERIPDTVGGSLLGDDQVGLGAPWIEAEARRIPGVSIAIPPTATPAFRRGLNLSRDLTHRFR